MTKFLVKRNFCCGADFQSAVSRLILRLEEFFLTFLANATMAFILTFKFPQRGTAP
jgi:hypothetical protein